jgi:hypothetical protein
MKRNRLKLVSEAPAREADDLSFPPPFGEQAKYLKLADEFLARTSVEQEQRNGKIISIGTGRRAKNRRSKSAA